ncbi:MAG: hypothetical protein PHI35_09610, partial [Victivallaceae bacterium]|nr:hypothetical protein [Victivallaceae bacterium]
MSCSIAFSRLFSQYIPCGGIIQAVEISEWSKSRSGQSYGITANNANEAPRQRLAAEEWLAQFTENIDFAKKQGVLPRILAALRRA